MIGLCSSGVWGVLAWAAGFALWLVCVSCCVFVLVPAGRWGGVCWDPVCCGGCEVMGWPMATIVRGHIVMREDELIGTPIGAPARFAECL